MAKNPGNPKPDCLRRQAEKALARRSQGASPADKDLQELVHELQVHRIELEMQNDELRRIQQKLEESQHKYFLLYDLAPVAYLTLDKNRGIREASLTAAALLGVERQDLAGTRLVNLIAPSSQDVFHLYWRGVVRGNTEQTCEVELSRKEGPSVWVYMKAAAAPAEGEGPRWYVSLTNISEQKRMEEELRALSRRLGEMQEDERSKVAHELHDEVSQYLAAATMLLDSAIKSPSKKGLIEVRDALNEVASRVRDLAENLRPPMLDDLGLEAALRWYIERYTAQTHVRVAFRHSQLGRPLPLEVSTAAYRIVQAALLNVAHHAGVKEALVEVSTRKDTLLLLIEDRGVGFDRSSLTSDASVGMAGMRERARAQGGTLAVQSEPGKGTSVVAHLPIAATHTGPGRETALSPEAEGLNQQRHMRGGGGGKLPASSCKLSMASYSVGADGFTRRREDAKRPCPQA